ncbi:MAG: acetate--CoA ligase family protein, partial [Hamadaea sp.]|nr:acetate--CoA ligase family protein [Hamadaea sp.]
MSLFAPASIAVFGASGRPGSWGRQLADGALRSGVDVQLVNHRPGAGFLLAPERPVELAVIAVPAAGFAAAVDTALAAGATSVVGVTAGLSPAESARIASVVRAAGARLLGPNCLGVFDAVSGLSLVWGELPPGDVTLLSQSGNLALELGAIARRSGLGFRRFASLGDCADLGVADLLPQHGGARAIALYLEDMRGARALIEQAASVVDEGVPVALLAAGRSAAGAVAAATHTGALTGDHAVLAAACRDAGIRLTRTPTELIEACRAPIRRGRVRRLGVVCDGGGHGVVAADLASAAGIDVMPPVDLAGAGERDKRAYADSVEALAARDDVDAVLLTGYFGGYSADEPELADTEAQVADALATCRLPLYVQSYAGFPATNPSPTVRRLTAAGVPVWPAIEHAVAALAHDDTVRLRPNGSAEPQRTAPQVIALDGDPYWTGRVLLPEVVFARAEEVRDVASALAAAERIGYPVALKALGRAHKSDDGGVVLGLTDPAALAAAFGAMPQSPAYAVEELHDLGEGVEIFVGARRDPAFGPVVSVGAGGLLAEVLADVAL